MEIVKHLWDVNQFITKLKSPLVADLQIFYMQKCKNFSNSVKLPQQNFGPLAKCSHCGSLWSTVDHQARIASGKKMSKSVKKIVRRVNENPDQKISKARATLAQKAIKNEMNRLVIKCSVCSKNTELPFKKKRRLKSIESNNTITETPQRNRKKKKKKSKDKTAGLNISGTPVSHLKKKDNSKTPMISPAIMPKIIPSKKKLSVSTQKPKKPKKLNIERLKRLMNEKTSPKRKNLHSFLAELR